MVKEKLEKFLSGGEGIVLAIDDTFNGIIKLILISPLPLEGYLEIIIYMKNLFRDFISYEKRDYNYKIGRTVASSLTGFLVGAVTTHIIWFTTFKQAIDFINP